jgi:lysophospholipase L1-like esterase
MPSFSPRRLLPVATLLLMAAGDPSTPASRMDKADWAAQFNAQQQELRQNSYDIVLLGDSIMHELQYVGPQSFNNIDAVWQRWFACRRTIDLGFTGDTTANLLWRIENGLLPTTPPKLAVVLIGTNNDRPALGWSAQQTAQGIVTIVDELHRRLPGTRILVMGIPPNAHGARVAEIIDQVNATLAARDWTADNAKFVATADLFETNGELDTSLFREPHQGRPALHPDAHGWELMAERIMPAAGQPAPCPGGPAAP